jgi:PAS domain S-box-containing protein
MYGVTLLLEKLEIDDVVGAVPVHLGAGIWGTLADPLCGTPETWGTGLGRWEQLLVQATGVGVCFVWAFGLGFLLLWLINRHFPLRIGPKGERIGLNVAEHGASTEILDLLTEMDNQRRMNDYSQPVSVEPHTEIGQIAQQYNRVLTDINAESRRRQAAVKALEQQTALLQLLRRVATASNEARTVEEAMQICVEEICSFGEWPLGHVYLLDDRGTGELIPADIWHIDNAQRFRAFREVTKRTRFRSGEGMPGRVLADRSPSWIADLTDGAHGPRDKEAREAGIMAGFAFPVMAGRDVVAVLEFFSTEALEPDETMLEIMASVGTQLGRVVERQKSEEARFKTVVDNMPAMVLLRDLNGRFILVNRKYEEFYRVTNDFVRGKTLHEVDAVADLDLLPDENAAHDREVIENSRVIEHELTGTRNGEIHTLASVKFPITDHLGETVAVGGIELDISDRKQHEAELADLVRKVQMARDQAMHATHAKSQFLANMSHELRTPMNAIIGFSELVMDNAKDVLPERQYANMEKIMTSAEHLLSLINDILDLSKIEAGRVNIYPVEFPLEPLVVECMRTVEPIIKGKKLQLLKNIESDLPVLLTDKDKVRQILINLLSNAMKFTERGKVTVKAQRRGEDVMIAVADTGIGIPKDAMGRIFDEFSQVDDSSTRRYGGTGLGLTITRHLAQLLGGDVTVESTVGIGSTFTVTIPQRYVPDSDTAQRHVEYRV